MCELCTSESMAGCQDCGANICFDAPRGDDFIRPAYVTASGDLFCDRCGRQVDIEEDEMFLDEGDYYPYPY